MKMKFGKQSLADLKLERSLEVTLVAKAWQDRWFSKTNVSKILSSAIDYKSLLKPTKYTMTRGGIFFHFQLFQCDFKESWNGMASVGASSQGLLYS